MLAKRITKVALTRTREPTPGDQTYAGTDWWLVEWTVSSSTKDEHLVQSHYTEKAARRHVSNLMEDRQVGLSVDDVYRESV